MSDLLCRDCGTLITKLTKTGRCRRCNGCQTGLNNTESGHLARIRELPQSKVAQRENGRKAVESGHLARIRELPQSKVAQRESGRRLSRMVNELPQMKAIRKENGRKAVESGQLARIDKLPQSKEARRDSGRRNVESGHLARIRKLRLGKRPTGPERILYGLLFGNAVTRDGLVAQHSFVDGSIPDAMYPSKKLILELDGGGHHVYRDRHAEDIQKDITRMLAYNTVLRETDESVLFLKTLAILESERRP